MQTYKIEINCWNCHGTNDFVIPKGTLVKVFVEGKKCVHCGCLVREYNNP
ncbi:hypothetical protein LCGC14_0363600 [marine sediment metagenome]|uniref:Uncharacterized protein n=1 Tax=marine sediment metagenome TaxID=412755 RepID=A0A0F9WFQ7_9ZZZZ